MGLVGADKVAGGRSYTQVDLVAGGILTGALVLFIVLGGRVMPDAVAALMSGGGRTTPILTTALILNVALVLFSWRRCAELRQQRDARQAAEARALRLAAGDFTTGLLNRGALTEAADRLFPEAREALALLVIDLDHFKKVNDHYGHSAGDSLLQSVAQRIRENSPPSAVCGRLGGDEFAVVLVGPHARGENASATAARILESLDHPIPVDGGVAQIGASIGLASATAEMDRFAALLRRGDIAMYQAKKQGRNGFAWFDASMEAEVQRQNQLEADMRAGIPKGEFLPFFQPQFTIGSDTLHGFEVLARWNHPTEGLIEPDNFIGLAEATGLISNLSQSVMRQALVEAAGWDASLTIGVNISPIQLKDPLLDQRIMKLLVETGFPARRLELEITESALFEDLDIALTNIESLKALGVTMSLDDFGTGYSSLARLKALPFDRIKIDRSFVLSMLENQDSAAIVNAITTLGASLQLPVTAEGIETSAMREHLDGIGCSQGQGWLYGRPLSIPQLREQFPQAVGGKGRPLPDIATSAPADDEIVARDRRSTRRGGSGARAA